MSAVPQAPDLSLAARVRASVRTLSDVKAERISWLWPGRIPRGKLSIIDGDPGVGKSTLSLDLAARVSTGAAWPDGGRSPLGHVVLMSAEDGLADTIRPRLDAAGADAARVHAITGVPTVVTDENGKEQTGYRPPHLGDLDHIEEVVKKTGAVLLVIDVLMAYMPSGVDAHRDQDVRGVLHRLAAMAERTECAVLLLRHMNKSQGGPALYRGGGSIGIVGAARAGFVAARDPDDEALVVLAPTKNNVAAMPAALGYRLVQHENEAGRIEWTGVVNRRAGDLLRSNAEDEDREERDALTEFIRDMVKGGPVPVNDAEKRVREGFGAIPKRSMNRARKRAGIETRKTAMSGGWEWCKPEKAKPEGAKADPNLAEEASTQSPGPFGPFDQPVAPSACLICGGPLCLADLDAADGICIKCAGTVAL